MERVLFAAFSAVSVLLSLGGVVSFIVGLRRLRLAAVSRGWPTVTGVVRSSQVISNQDQNGALFHAAVTFEYRVGGRAYTADRVTAEQLETSSREAAQSVVARYPEGAAIEVFYSPDDPSQALLEPGLTLASLVVPIIGVALSGLGAGLWALVQHLSAA